MRSSTISVWALVLVGCSAPMGESKDYEVAGGEAEGGATYPDPEVSTGRDAGSRGDAATPPPPDVGGDGGADAAHDAAPDAPVACPVLVFPSGLHLKTVKDSVMSAAYKNHLGPGDTAPECFLDTDNLVDDEGNKYDLSVHVAAHFQLSELVDTEISGGYGHLVVVSPAAVVALEKLRDAIGGPLDIVDGFRSPKHQEDVCNAICGNPLGCTGQCGANSRHIFGDGFDLPLSVHDATDEQRVCSAGFKSMSVEDSARMHVDQNPAVATCVPR